MPDPNQTLPVARLSDVNAHLNNRTPVGKTPWRAVSTSPTLHTVKDYHGNTLFTATPGIACRVVTAVNSHSDLNAECVVLGKLVLDLRQSLSGGTQPSEAVKLIDDTLEQHGKP